MMFFVCKVSCNNNFCRCCHLPLESYFRAQFFGKKMSRFLVFWGVLSWLACSQVWVTCTSSSAQNQSLLPHSLKALKEVCWYLPLILKPKNIRTVSVAPNKACFFASAKIRTWGFGSALEISFYIQLSKTRLDCMQRTWVVLEKFEMNLQVLRCQELVLGVMCLDSGNSFLPEDA